MKNILLFLQKLNKKNILFFLTPLAFILSARVFPADSQPHQLVKIKSPDETKIVDVVNPDGKNRLTVDTYISQISSSGLATLNKNLRYEDMNAANGGIAKGTSITGTTWRAVHCYEGVGIVHGWVINLETKDHWLIRWVIDGSEIFGSNGILLEDLYIDTSYDLDNPDTDSSYSGIGLFYGIHDKIIYTGPNNYGMRFSTSTCLYIKRETGEANKKFNAGLMTITKGI